MISCIHEHYLCGLALLLRFAISVHDDINAWAQPLVHLEARGSIVCEKITAHENVPTKQKTASTSFLHKKFCSFFLGVFANIGIALFTTHFFS